MEKRDYKRIIDDILNLLDGSKNVKFSSTHISVERDVIYELVNELKEKTPEEIKTYAKIVKQKQQIMADARRTADDLINSTTEQMHRLISESEISFRAKDEANEIINDASIMGQQIIDDAVAQANEINQSVIEYTDDVLVKLQTIITSTMDNVTTKYDAFMKSLNASLEVVIANRNQLYPPQPTDEQETYAEPGQEVDDQQGDAARPIQNAGAVDDYAMEDNHGSEPEFEDYTVDINGIEE